ncbi:MULTISPECIES: DUF1800 domain-containing protein [Nitrospirillum]|uniref:Uncharacterized protein (DUF1800 family) n=1 Tax=Nitrospirillum amazonense TaxID=28077 RepID=A0A560GCV5_9PROT|nr:DUF1800 domain-containing protein [Nitrospirillum amazonense]MEC4594868.1 DUF1800 domain-containing protein [Nitrospirillum amazonense]TWB31745.1 uncharacterized protein (DUF1800 family) [Nitrospirillum amazonense]
MTLQAAIATNRFGLGARPGDIAAAQSDPRGWLEAQLARDPGLPPELHGVEDSATRLTATYAARKEKDEEARKPLREALRAAYRDDAARRTRAAIATDAPLRERLVHFWSNHFTVSTSRPIVAAAVVPYENEAIRPHVTGRFADMLLAATRHPVMLAYLDNAVSVGPDSLAGIRRQRGLNENLGRELLELHTLGVDGGYSQTDVRELARILTGWSIAAERDRDTGTFLFRPNLHEPGDKILLGQRYSEDGMGEGLLALQRLARHPATARHLATKLARHFIADDPPPAVVAALEKSYHDSDGHLGEVTRTLLHQDAAWAPEARKVKTPTELVVSTGRALGTDIHPAVDDGDTDMKAARAEPALRSLALLGQLPFAAPSPAGWPDQAADWVGPEAMVQRVDWALTVGEKLGDRIDPRRIAEQALGPFAGDATRQAVARAPSAAEGLALLISAPEFQRR